MPKLTRQMVISSLNSFAAAMLALYVAFALDLQRPFWAMMTVYIVSNPFAGAVRSKAFYRMAGTLLGATFTVVLVPNLVNAPIMLSLALALWVAGCMVFSLLDRTPRSYMLLLSGYTVALIGFPVVDQPDIVFDIAVSRVEEIILGILCATLMHSIVFPRSVGDVLTGRLGQWVESADRWLLDLAEGVAGADRRNARRELAAAISDIRIQATHLPFDTSRLRERQAAVRVLHDRMIRLLPLLSEVADRRLSLVEIGYPLPPEARARLADVAAWLWAGADPAAGLDLAIAIRDLAAAQAGEAWRGLLLESLLTQIADAVVALAECHALLSHVREPERAFAPALAGLLANAVARPLSSDLALALRSGLVCVAAVMVTSTFWIATGWPDGAAAASLAAIFCALFASLDDPAPAIVSFSFAAFVTLVIAAFYCFGVFQAIDGFPLLATVLFPVLFAVGLLIANPKTTVIGSPLAVTFGSSLALQPTFHADFAAFVNGNLAVFVGSFVAVSLTRAARSMTAEMSAQRLLRLIWQAIARFARKGLAADRTDIAAILADRLSLLAPRLALQQAGGPDIGVGALRDLRLAMNLSTLKQVSPALDDDERARVERLFEGVAAHYRALGRSGARTSPDGLLPALDAILSGLAGRADLRRAAHSLVGIRRDLFPAAAPFIAAKEQLA